MPPALSKYRLPRDSNTGTAFPIIFAVVAFLIVTACVIWGYYIPKWRQRYPIRPSSTRYNCLSGAAKYSSESTPPALPPRLPTQPAILRGFRKPPRVVSQYNPRIHTPFLNSPQTEASISLSTMGSKASKAGSRTIGHRQSFITQLETPRRERKNSAALDDQIYFENVFQSSRTIIDSGVSSSRLTASDTEGSIKGVLPMTPALVAKSAGRPPSLTRVLNKFPNPKTLSEGGTGIFSGSGGKLSNLPGEDSFTSAKGGVTGAVSPNVVLRADDYLGFSEFEKATKQRPSIRNELASSTSRSSFPVADNAPIGDPEETHWPHFSRKHGGTKRLSKRKGKEIKRETAVSAALPNNRSPIDNVRDCYDMLADRAKSTFARKQSFRKRYTPSTEPLNSGASSGSEAKSLPTPPTSPPPSRHSRMSILLPTPLRLRRASLVCPPKSPTPYVLSDKLHPLRSKSRPLSRTKHVSFTLQKSLRSKRDYRRSIGFYHPNLITSDEIPRPKPAFLASGRQSGCRSRSHYEGDGSVSSLTSHPSASRTGRRLGNSFAGSSFYSQDTNDIAEQQRIRWECLKSMYQPKATFRGQPGPRRAHSMEVSKKEVDHCNLQPGRTSTSLSANARHRRVSDVGPQSPGLKSSDEDLRSSSLPVLVDGAKASDTTAPIPTIQIARTSDDVFSDQAAQDIVERAKVLKRVLELELAWSETDLVYHTGDSTAGGCGWI